jgi:glycine betaine catabolism A
MSVRLPPPQAGLEPTLPSSWYRSEKVFALEKERIFCRDWLCVARAEELAGPGAYRVLDVLGESILLVRNREGELRAFYNVCRHRGTRLCRDSAAGPANAAVLGGGISGGRITCPYHQWSYDLDGRLIAAPHLSAEAGFDKSLFSLYPVGLECWGGFVFLNLTPAKAAPLAAQLGAIPERIARYPLSELRIGHTIRYAVGANWKVICENYNECYHCAGVHPELCAVVPAFRERGGANLDWMRGIPHRPGAYTYTTSGTTARRPFPGLNADEQVRHKGELFYPNLFLSLACDHAAVFILEPRGATRTDIVCHFLFEPYEMAKNDFDPRDATEFWDLVNRQDWTICEAVQQGISARVHERGYYAPMEDFNLDIRRYVLERIGDAVGAA